MHTEKQRHIFRYYNGNKKVAADPMKLAKKLATAYPKESTWEHDLKLLQLQNAESLEAFGRMAELGRQVFEIAEFSEDDKGKQSGLTEIEVVELLALFATWMGDVKKNTAQKPILRTTTASVSSGKKSATNAYAASGSTANATSTENV